MDERFFCAGELLCVLTAEPLDRFLDYKAPEQGCALGSLVKVPLGPRQVLGVVWGVGHGPKNGGYDAKKIRAVSKVLDAPPLQNEFMAFLQRAADYTLTPLNAMFKLATRAPGLDAPPSLQRVYRLGAQAPSRMTPARQKVLDVVGGSPHLAFTLGELASQAGVSTSVVKGLATQGALRDEDAPRDLPYPALDPNFGRKALSPDQNAGAQVLRDKVDADCYSTTLLKGVTGSGKTEVYLEAIARCLELGRQALVLLPEIALSGEFMRRVEARFGAMPAQWHSGVTYTERRRCWNMVSTGDAQLIVGARSALFLPFQNLGLIVVDEEHDTSYKQEEGVLYHARDMAVLRASLCQAQVVLASATPSLESWVNASLGKYERVDLKSRYGVSQLPDMTVVDMREQKLPQNTWVSAPLKQAVTQRLEKGEQALIFLNRRGYAPLTICRACGHQLECPTCDARLVEHRVLNRLMCHQCGETCALPQACPKCDAHDKLHPIGPGIERLGEEIAALFPEATISVLSSDLYGSARAMKEHIEHIAKGGADIIIGTQLVAKGHNFPQLTLVGVIDADLGLQGSDLRASERTFQLMRQVAGRAGRADKAGEAMLQTYQPEHPVIRAIISDDEDAFLQSEAFEREAAQVPPYGRMAGVIVSGSDLSAVSSLAQSLARHSAPLHAIGAQVYGPAPAPIARIRGRHRMRLLVRAAKTAPLQRALRTWRAQVREKGDLKVAIDVDPQSFF